MLIGLPGTGHSPHGLKIAEAMPTSFLAFVICLAC
jgi:hypothetical protein